MGKKDLYILDVAPKHVLEDYYAKQKKKKIRKYKIIEFNEDHRS
jgi:hypothetical protein